MMSAGVAGTSLSAVPSDPLLRMKVKWPGAFVVPVRRCGWVRVTDVAKCRCQELVACRAALPFEGL
jgi:hypothetical protein